MVNEYPEHEKLSALKGANNTVGEFLDWLAEEDLVIAEYGTGDPEADQFDSDSTFNKGWPHRLYQHLESNTSIIGRFFDIDPKKLDKEKDEMLVAIRAQHRD